MARLRIVAGYLFVAAVVPTSLSSQTDTTAAISGRAISAYNGKPLVGVMIAVPAVRKFVVSDSNGTFRLSGLPAGKQKIRVAYEGRQTEEYQFGLGHGRTKKLTVVLDVDAVDLAPVVVQTRFPNADWQDLGGFYARRKIWGGWGHFYTREDIERLHLPSLQALLAREGIWSHCMGTCPPSYAGGCSVRISVDAMPFMEEDYRNVPIDQVAGVEIYGSSFAPFVITAQAFSPLEAQSACGSIAIWTR